MPPPRPESPAARAAGYEPLAARLLYRWTPACGVSERPGRLVFRAEPDGAVFLDGLRRIHSATLDAHALGAVAEGGLDRAVQQDLDFFRWCPSPGAWWQVAHPRQGGPVGTHIPARNPAGPCVAFIGVLSEHRGHGYASTRERLNFRPHPPQLTGETGPVVSGGWHPDGDRDQRRG